MSIIRRIKLPNEVDPRDLGASSSNIIYDGDTGITMPLNDKIIAISSQDLSNYVSRTELNTALATKSGFEVATTTTAGLMSAQDKIDLDRLKISGSSPVTLSNLNPIEVQDAHEDDINEFIVNLAPQVTPIPGDNLINQNNNVEGYYIGANGTITAQAGDWYTELIPVSQGDHIYVKGYHNQTDNGNKRLHGYNASGVWSRQLNFAAVPARSTLPAYYETDAVIPAGVAYIRFSYRMLDTQVIVSKSDIPYEPYGEHYQFTPYSSPLTITKTADTTTTYTVAFTSFYGGKIKPLTGEIDKTWEHIDAYDGETLPGEWWSTYENSSTASTPTSGAEVIYELATPQTYYVSGQQLTTETGYNKFEVDKGAIETFTYQADGSIVSNLNITSGVITLGNTSLDEQHLIRLLQLL